MWFKKGVFKAEFALCISNGKRVNIRMKGQTLHSFQGKLVLKKTTVELPPVPWNMQVPVVVPIALTNIGTNQVSYVLDTSEFCLNHPVLFKERVVSFQNESGQLQPGERQNLLLLFRPNSIERIFFTLTIRVKDFFKEIESLKVKVFGRGVADFSMERLDRFFKIEDKVDEYSRVSESDQRKAHFSNEQLDFRNADIQQKHRRLLFIHNRSSESVLSFKFEQNLYFRLV